MTQQRETTIKQSAVNAAANHAPQPAALATSNGVTYPDETGTFPFEKRQQCN